MGLACVMQQHADDPRASFDARLIDAARQITAARPTAVNLGWAVDRMLTCAAATSGAALGVVQALLRTAEAIRAEDVAMCERIGHNGLALLPDNARVLTHCNTGALATAGIGTALAPIYLAHRAGRALHVYATETRPLLQGSRLTSWELQQAGVPVTLLADGAAGSLMARGAIDCVLLGADRIAANGDAANKIGTYALAVLARHHAIPFYVAAPMSSIDKATATGADIPIEQREPNEVRLFRDSASAPPDVDVFNPAFDVTPATLITAIVSDRGVHYPPYDFTQALA
jgi:methylthioribose-1-phosphate isomerase